MAALAAKGAKPVAASRDAGKAEKLFGDKAEAVSFSFEDKDTWEPAFRDISAVFLLGPPLDPNLDTLLAPFIKYVKARGTRRLVYFSALGVEEMAESMPFHSKMEELVKKEGFDFAILRPTFFGSNFRHYEYENITERNIVYSPAADGKAAFVDPRDVGEVAAEVLLKQGTHAGRVYQLTGPEALSYYDAAAILSDQLGRKISYPEPSPEEYAGTLGQAGAPPFVAEYMNKVYALIRQGHADKVTSDVKEVTGREPRTLQDTIAYTFKQ